jgi:hypothetical protein
MHVHPLFLNALNPVAEAVFPGRPQTEFGAGFQHGVKHAVAIAPAAGQQESTSCRRPIFQGDDLAGHVAKGPCSKKGRCFGRVQKVQVGQLFGDQKRLGAEQGQKAWLR